MAFTGLVPDAAETRPASDESTPSEPSGGRAAAAPARSSAARRLVTRLQESVWLPVVLKIGGAGLGMLVLAGIGASSIAASSGGIAIVPSAGAARDFAGAWISAPRAHESPRNPQRSPQVPPTKHAQSAPACGTSGAELCASDAGAPPGQGITADGKVILNLATVEELTRLPGVGTKRAESIMVLRLRLKGFKRPTDLLRVRGIGMRSLKRMLPHFVLDAPREPADAGQTGVVLPSTEVGSEPD